MKIEKVLIVGLGLIGGSYAKGLTKKNIKVYAIDKNENTIKYAKENKIIIDGTTKTEEDFIKNFDIIIFSLYPKAFLNFIKENKNIIKKNCFILDVTGVKKSIVPKINDIIERKFEFIPTHPMAGREVCGVENSDEKIFINANYIITPTEINTKEGINLAKEIGKLLEFKNISLLSLDEHDEMIAFLSQLTHCIAISLMTCKNSNHLAEYTGDSFRDLTRIANINKDMWTELFLLNKEHLIQEIDRFIKEIEDLKSLIESENVDKIKQKMQISKERRIYFDKNNGGDHEFII